MTFCAVYLAGLFPAVQLARAHTTKGCHCKNREGYFNLAKVISVAAE